MRPVGAERRARQDIWRHYPIHRWDSDRSMVTLLALIVTERLMSMASMTVCDVVTVSPPDAVRGVPKGTPCWFIGKLGSGSRPSRRVWVRQFSSHRPHLHDPIRAGPVHLASRVRSWLLPEIAWVVHGAHR